MGKILVINGSDFSQNRIEKVDINKQVEKSINSQTLTIYSSSTLNSSLKNNDQ